MLAKCSLVAGMFVLEADANLSRRAAATNPPGAHHILLPSCGNHLEICLEILVLEGCPVPLSVFFLSSQHQGPGSTCPQQPETKLPPFHLVKRENSLMSHQRGAAVQDCLSDYSVQSLDLSPATP